MDDQYIEENSEEEHIEESDCIEEEEEKEPNSNVKWKIELNAKIKFWNKLVKIGFTYQPNICSTCNIGKMEITIKKESNILNPFYCRCRNIKCRRKFKLRNFTFPKGLKNVAASIVYTILDSFIKEGLNAVKIKSILQNKMLADINIKFFHNILLNYRKIIYEYQKKNYNQTLIGGIDNLGIPE